MASFDDDATAKLWPTTQGAVKLIDGLHSATGLPWWATLSLTALGVRAALLPFTLKQMHASTALMAEWRLATQRAAMRHAQTSAPTAGAARLQSAALASTNSTASHNAVLTGSVSKGNSQSTATAQYSALQVDVPSAAATSLLQPASCAGDASAVRHSHHRHSVSEEKGTAASAGASDQDERAQHDDSASSRLGLGQLQHGRPGLGSILNEYRRLRAASGAPSAVWLLGSPLLQLSVFGTSVFAARHMAACHWPGFASGGVLWFPDLTKAAAVIHWAQGIESTAVAFPYGQLGVVLPVAISLTLFANINLGFTQPRGALKPSGDGAVMAYVMGALRTVMEWATVPVLAVAMCLPHGALVYWLSSSTVSLAQSAILRQPAVRRALQLPVQNYGARPGGQARAAADAACKPAAANDEELSVDQLFVQAAENRAKGDAARALEIVTAIRAQQPQHARAHFAAGQLHADLQQWQLAEEAYVAGASLEADLAQRARCLLGAGVAQHKQGDLEAALQAFARASSDALFAAGISEAALSGSTAASCSSAAPVQDVSATSDGVSGARLAETALSDQSAASCRSGTAQEIVRSDHSSGGSTAETASATSFRMKHAPCSSSAPAQQLPGSSHASQGSRGDASSGAQSQAGAAVSSDSRDAQASTMAERTAVRALMAQASVLKRSGRLHDAMQALTLAAILDPGVEVHIRKLQAEMRC